MPATSQPSVLTRQGQYEPGGFFDGMFEAPAEVPPTRGVDKRTANETLSVRVGLQAI